MIFLTVGTSGFQFTRLLKTVDQVLIQKNTQEKLVVQTGYSKHKFGYRNTELAHEFPYNKLIHLLKNARIVITHGGPATVFLSLQYGINKPFVIPRRKNLGEHFNDNQSDFVSRIPPGYITMVPSENFSEQLGLYIKSPEKNSFKPILTSKSDLIKHLIDYTEDNLPSR